MRLLDDISRVAAEAPDKIALAGATETLTYGELERHSTRLAAYIRQVGVDVGDRVAIFMENSPSYVVSILACIRAGAIWVPINHSSSDEALRRVGADSMPKLVIVDEKHGHRLPHTFGMAIPAVSCGGSIDATALAKSSVDMRDIWNDGRLSCEPGQDESRLAYIIYTSGSTGAAKGVAVTFQSLNNYVYRTCDDLKFHDGTKTLSVTPYYFDAPLGSLFCTLVRGGALFIFPNLLHPRLIAKKILEVGITYVGTTPGLFRILTEALQAAGDVRFELEVVGVGGDIPSREHLLDFLHRYPHVLIFNRYGPTETTSVASSFRITPEALENVCEIPIGEPLEGVNFYLLDENGELITKAGMKGELCIGGCQVMQGYWNDPELTNRVLLRDRIAGDVVYRTGDVCSRNLDGNYVFHNRVGGLLKRHGVRVHVSEVELAVKGSADVRDCVCIVSRAQPKERVIAYVISEDAAPSQARLLEAMYSCYPLHVVPDEVLFVSVFPYTTVGKIDRKALESMHGSSPVERA